MSFCRLHHHHCHCQLLLWWKTTTIQLAKNCIICGVWWRTHITSQYSGYVRCRYVHENRIYEMTKAGNELLKLRQPALVSFFARSPQIRMMRGDGGGWRGGATAVVACTLTDYSSHLTQNESATKSSGVPIRLNKCLLAGGCWWWLVRLILCAAVYSLCFVVVRTTSRKHTSIKYIYSHHSTGCCSPLMSGFAFFPYVSLLIYTDVCVWFLTSWQIVWLFMLCCYATYT